MFYDARSFLTEIHHSTGAIPSQTTVARYAYDYDLAGNREWMKEYDASNSLTVQTDWDYDAANRLTHEERTVGVVPLDIAYQYDQNGNRTREIHGTEVIRYTYNEND